MTPEHAQPAHARAGRDGVWFSRPAASAVLTALRRFEQHEARANGAGAARSPLLREILAALEATHRGDGTPLEAARFVDEPANRPDRAPSKAVARADDRITIKEAAVVLGHSEQYTRRLADAESFGPVVRVPQSTTVARSEVLAYRARTRSQTR